MGVPGLLKWIRKKYPQAIRQTGPSFNNYDMLFVDIPQYVSAIFHFTAKPYSNSSLLMSNILSDIDRLVQFAQPTQVIFFAIDSTNGLSPYAKTILKRYRKIKISEDEARRLAQQLSEKEGYVLSENKDAEILNINDLEVGDEDEFKQAFEEFSKLGEENSNQINSIQKVQAIVDKFNKSQIEKAKKAKKERLSLECDYQDVELDENELPKMLTVDEFLNTVKKADYDKERVPDINEFLIEFQNEFVNFIENKIKSDSLYQNKKVIYSNRFDQGEAEHKIMSFLRIESQKQNWDPNTRICICSMDNDFINLSLQTYIRNITLLNFVRDDLTALLIEIKILRDLIGKELNVDEEKLASRLDDIVMISLLISNDFTPSFPDLPSCSMETLFELYKAIISEKPDFMLFKDGEFEIESVKFFLNTLIKKAIAPDQNTAKAYLMKFEEMFENPPIEEMSINFFETIAWTMYLYKYGIPSYSHYYKYEYAPPLSTAIQFVDAIRRPLNSFKESFMPLSGPVLYVLSAGKSAKNIDKRLADKINDPDSPISYMLAKNKQNNADDDSKKTLIKIDIELTINTIEKYKSELHINERKAVIEPAVIYSFQDGKIDTQNLILNSYTNKIPFRFITDNVKDDVLTPEFWPVDENMTFEKATSMIGQMIFFSRPYKIPAIVKEVLKYDDVTAEEREKAFNQVYLEETMFGGDEIKEKLIFFKATPLSQYEFKENTVKDVVIYAPYSIVVSEPNLVLHHVKKMKENDFVITRNGLYGKITNLNVQEKVATVECVFPQKIDEKIREIVSNDSENYLTEEEFAKQVGITKESVQLIASRLILLPDNSNIAIKFYSSRYNKLMCGFCIQNEEKKFLFSKKAVPIAKKYLNQPKIFKFLIEKSASHSQLDENIDEPEIKLEEETNLKPNPIQNDTESNNQNSRIQIISNQQNNSNSNQQNNLNSNQQNNLNSNQQNNLNSNQQNNLNSNQQNNSNSNQQNKSNSNQQNNSTSNNRIQNNHGGSQDRGGSQSFRGRGRGKGRGGFQSYQNKERQIEEKRKLYLNEPDTSNDTIFYDNEEEDNFTTDEETDINDPFTIKLPTTIRSTIISRLDNFFNHHKSVNASLFYPFESTSLSIESIHKIDQILTQTPVVFEKKTINVPYDHLMCVNEYIELFDESFKAGDRVVLKKNRGYGVFGHYGTIICANDDKCKAIVCLDQPIQPSNSITFTNYRMKNNFSKDCVVEFPYSVLKLVDLEPAEIETEIKVIEDSDGNSYLLKTIVNESDIEKIQRILSSEYRVLEMIDHPNIIKSLGLYINDEILKNSILLEYCPFNIENVIENKMLSKVQVVHIIYQIAQGMKYIHSLNIYNINLIPSNILISNDCLSKICGFENSQIDKSGNEILKSDDVYAFGNLVFYILSGCQFPNKENKAILKHFSILAQQLIEACWFYDKSQRPTFEIICNILEENNLDLAFLSPEETQEVSELVQQYKLVIP